MEFIHETLTRLFSLALEKKIIYSLYKQTKLEDQKYDNIKLLVVVKWITGYIISYEV